MGPSSINWVEFKRWLLKTHVRRNALDLFRTARKYHVVLWRPNEASGLVSLSDSHRRLVMASLSNLSKFIGVYKTWKDIVANTGLKWSNGNSEDIIIKRFTRSRSPEEITDWIISIKEAIPALSVFMDFAAATGIRFVEAVRSYSLIIDLSHQNNLSEYYNVEGSLLEHYRFRDLFIRRSKKVFISFISEDLVKRVAVSRFFSKSAIENRIKRSELSSAFGDLREYWASYMTKYLRQPEIDFLQGRVSTSVLMRELLQSGLDNRPEKQNLRGRWRDTKQTPLLSLYESKRLLNQTSQSSNGYSQVGEK